MGTEKEMIIEGYALLFNTPTVLWEYEGNKIYETIDPRALDDCDMSDVSFKYNHSDEILIVGAVRNGTLKLTVDDKGLKVRVNIANTTVGRDLFEMVKSGLINKQSFAFRVEEDDYDTHTFTRTIRKIETLYDCSAVDRPAYPQTSLYVYDPEELERLRAEIKSKFKKNESEKLKELKDKILLEERKRQLKKELEIERLKAEII